MTLLWEIYDVLITSLVCGIMRDVLVYWTSYLLQYWALNLNEDEKRKEK